MDIAVIADDDLSDDLIAFAGRLADAARAQSLPRFRAGLEVTSKPGALFDPVTDADREAERLLRRMIADQYPDHGVIGEEFGAERADADDRWVIDPIDGTRAFVCGVATWATLIGFERRAAPVLGVIDQPFTDERWTGRRGATIYSRRGQSAVCRTSGLEDISAARLSTTDPRREAYFSDTEADAFARVASRTRVARFSLDAYAYGLLALGELDLVIESGLKHHDFSALIPVVTGAGGVITCWNGGDPAACERGSLIASASEALHREALNILNG